MRKTIYIANFIFFILTHNHFSFLLLFLFLLVAVTVLAGVLSSLLLSLAAVPLLKCKYHLLYQPLFLSFPYVSCCFISVYPTTVFLRYRNTNKVTQLFCVILAIAPYGDLFYHKLQF